MTSLMWVAVCSLVGGILVAAATSGSVPPSATAGLVVLVAMGAIVTAGRSARDRRRVAREFAYQPPTRSATTLPSDLRVAAQARELLGERAIPWLRQEEFVGTWRDDRLRYLREFMQLADTRPPIGHFALDVALDDLAEATNAFIATHDATTVTDPLIRESSWRMVRGTDPETSTMTSEGVTEATQLREQAARIVAAFAELRVAMSELTSER